MSGANWDNTVPAEGDNVSAGAGVIRTLKEEIEDRLNKEHTTFNVSAAGGEHKEGSAMVYYATAAASLTRPNGDAFTTADEGRIRFTSDTNIFQVYSGSGWIDTNYFAVGVSETLTAGGIDLTSSGGSGIMCNFLSLTGHSSNVIDVNINSGSTAVGLDINNASTGLTMNLLKSGAGDNIQIVHNGTSGKCIDIDLGASTVGTALDITQAGSGAGIVVTTAASSSANAIQATTGGSSSSEAGSFTTGSTSSGNAVLAQSGQSSTADCVSIVTGTSSTGAGLSILTGTSSTGNCLDLQCVGSSTNQAHINFSGDPANTSTPIDGDFWFDGSDLVLRVGSSSYTLDMTVVP